MIEQECTYGEQRVRVLRFISALDGIDMVSQYPLRGLLVVSERV